MVQPWTIAPWPMVTSSPMVVGWVPDWTWTTVPSWTLVLAPIRMAFTSPRMTTFIQTELSGPMWTSPMTWALSST